MADNKEIKDILEKMDGRLDNMDITLTKQSKDLEYHIKRSDQADEAIKFLDAKIKPLDKHVNMVEGALKLLGLLALVAGIYSAVK